MADFPETADGTLVVMVCRAKHLPNRRKLDKQSPYVLLRINAVAKKTPSHFRAGQTPEWTHEIRFSLTRDRKSVMRLDVLDETKNDPTPIGGTEIDCASVFADPANLQESGKYILDGWYDLSFKERYAGKIFLEMTFYPSAPLVPPKLSQSASAYKYLPEPPAEEENDDSFRHSAPAVSAPISHASNDVFVSPAPPKGHFFRSSNPEPHARDDAVFVDNSRPKTSRFAKLKGKFMAKEPITGLWGSENKTSVADFGLKKADSALLRTPSPLDNLDELSAEIGLYQPSSSGYLPAPMAPSDDLAPPPPPPHSAFGSSPEKTPKTHSHAHGSPSRSPEYWSAPSSPPKNRRKPPPDVRESVLPPLDSTNIPFSADNFQLDTAPCDSLPTKVFHMDQPVKSLTVMDSDREKHAMNPNEIDPRYYAPTPSEHLSKSTHLQGGIRRFEESGGANSGYLGEGAWNVPGNGHGKFSPSVFQRINNENEGEENKPPVPPKIPTGLSEKEYYVLDKDSYLKDINGRRF